MRVTILTIGSRGDVQPYVALGRGLQAAGHEVTLATHPPFEALVRGRGLRFAPIAGDPRRVLETEAGRRMLASGRNGFAFLREIRRAMEAYAEQAFVDAQRACQGAQAILYAVLALAGYHLAERQGIPSFAAYLQPITRTWWEPPLGMPAGRTGRSFANRIAHFIAEQAFWQAFRPHINRMRREKLGLPPAPWLGFYDRLYRERRPLLYGYSAHVAPPPPDWPEFHHLTGYWFLDGEPGWQPLEPLLAFLEAGPPPVYVGFGSMADREAEGITRTVLEALRRAGRRGLLATGWGGLQPGDLPAEVHVIDTAPHDWLFPRMAAVVHHGGAGTTAAGLRAGIPSVLVPFMADQFYWGGRVEALGAGPAPVARADLDASRLARAIEQAVTDEGIGRRARELGERLRAEDGVGRAVEVFQRHLERG